MVAPALWPPVPWHPSHTTPGTIAAAKLGNAARSDISATRKQGNTRRITGSMSIRSACETGRRAWREQNLPARRGRFLNADQPPPACTVSGFAGSARDPSPPLDPTPDLRDPMPAGPAVASRNASPATGTGPGSDDRHPLIGARTGRIKPVAAGMDLRRQWRSSATPAETRRRMQLPQRRRTQTPIRARPRQRPRAVQGRPFTIQPGAIDHAPHSHYRPASHDQQRLHDLRLVRTPQGAPVTNPGSSPRW